MSGGLQLDVKDSKWFERKKDEASQGFDSIPRQNTTELQCSAAQCRPSLV